MKPEIDSVNKQGPHNIGASIPPPSLTVTTYFVFTGFIYFYCMYITFLHACYTNSVRAFNAMTVEL